MQKTIAQNYQKEMARDCSRADRSDFCNSHVYKATVRHFAAGVEVTVRDVQKERAKHPVQSDIPVYLQLPKERSEEEQARRDEENAKRSAHRGKQMVRWLLKSIQADHMLTLTTREAISDLGRFQLIYQRFIKLVRMRYPKLQYVAVHELQERGALHLHVAIRGRGDVHWLRRCWWMALGHRVEIDYSTNKPQLRALVKDGREWRYAGPEEVRGNIDLRGPSKRFGGAGNSWKTEKLAAYITKYMAKNFDKVEGVRRYWPSKNIERPFVERMWLNAVQFREAIREVHDYIRDRFAMRQVHIFAASDMPFSFFSGCDPSQESTPF